MDHAMNDNPYDIPSPSWRKPAGIMMILLLIGVYAWGVITIIEWLGDMPSWLLVIIYALAGVAWIAPLKPLLMWMETGRLRHFPNE